MIKILIKYLEKSEKKISAFFALLGLNCVILWFKGVEDIFKDIEWIILFYIICGTALFLFVSLLIEVIEKIIEKGS